MNRVKGPARLGFAAALLALMLAPLALGFHSAHAQGPDTAQYYGTGLSAGDAVGAWIDGTECSSTTVNAAGEWVLQVGPGDCSPEDGDTVNFSLNGEVAEQTETWTGGGTPSDAAGISLTVAAMPDDDDAMPDDDDDDMPAMPEEPDTGNAGLVGSSSSSPFATLALGILAVAGIAGARVATRRVS